MVPPHAASTETWGGQVGRICDIHRLTPLSFGSAVTVAIYVDVISGVSLSRAAYSNRITIIVAGVVVVASLMAPMAPAPCRTR